MENKEWGGGKGEGWGGGVGIRMSWLENIRKINERGDVF